MMRRDMLVRLEPNPMEVYLLALCVLSGLVGLVVTITTGHTANGLPAWLSVPWNVLLTVGGLGGLAGTFWRDAVIGQLIVRAAMWPIACGAAVYAVILGARFGWLQGIVVAAFGAAAAWRAIQITRRMRVRQ